MPHHQPFYIAKPFQLGMSVVVGVIFLMFLLVYRLAPNCKTYWRNVRPGAVVAADRSTQRKSPGPLVLLNSPRRGISAS